MRREHHLFKQRGHNALDAVRRYTLELRVHSERLTSRHPVEKRVDLRAVAHPQPATLADRLAVDERCAGGRHSLSSKDRHRGRLARAVHAEQAKALGAPNVQRKVGESHFAWRIASWRVDFAQVREHHRRVVPPPAVSGLHGHLSNPALGNDVVVVVVISLSSPLSEGAVCSQSVTVLFVVVIAARHQGTQRCPERGEHDDHTQQANDESSRAALLCLRFAGVGGGTP
mmetsp:Transcript_17147/g.44054  ORF Transcript_17147/g.44054 Transcript_17147/m.44054 type:complete len:228 (+) Transcript_17147:1197-1880(+)